MHTGPPTAVGLNMSPAYIQPSPHSFSWQMLIVSTVHRSHLNSSITKTIHTTYISYQPVWLCCWRGDISSFLFTKKLDSGVMTNESAMTFIMSIKYLSVCRRLYLWSMPIPCPPHCHWSIITHTGYYNFVFHFSYLGMVTQPDPDDMCVVWLKYYS